MLDKVTWKIILQNGRFRSGRYLCIRVRSWRLLKHGIRYSRRPLKGWQGGRHPGQHNDYSPGTTHRRIQRRMFLPRRAQTRHLDISYAIFIPTVSALPWIRCSCKPLSVQTLQVMMDSQLLRWRLDCKPTRPAIRPWLPALARQPCGNCKTITILFHHPKALNVTCTEVVVESMANRWCSEPSGRR